MAADSAINAASLPAVLLAAAMMAVVLFAPQVLGDGDTYWHIASGAWMLDHHEILRHDVFSYTVAGRPWIAQEWLSEVLMALAYRTAGWSGVVILFAAAVGMTTLSLGRHLGRWLGPLPVFVALVIAMALLSPSLLARPHLLALPVMEIWCASLVIARAENRAPSLWLLPLIVLWTNLHASFPVGLVLAAFLAAEAFQADRRQGMAWFGFTVVAACMTLLNPNGLDGVLFPLRLMNSGAVKDIIEWQPVDLHALSPIEPVLALVLYMILIRGFRPRFWRFVIFGGLIGAALLHTRNQMLVGLVGSLAIAPDLGEFFGVAGVAKSVMTGRSILVFGLAALIVMTIRLADPLHRRDDAVTPASALAQVPADLRARPVYNDAALGGYLIFNGIRPFIDGRADLYGADFMGRYRRALTEPGPLLGAELRQYQVAWAIVGAGSSAAAQIARRRDWRLLFAGRYAEVFEKR